MLQKNQYMKSSNQYKSYFALPIFMYVKDLCKPNLSFVSFCKTDSRFSHQK